MGRGYAKLVCVKLRGRGLRSFFSGFNLPMTSMRDVGSTMSTTCQVTGGNRAMLLDPYYTDFSLFGDCRSHNRRFGRYMEGLWCDVGMCEW